MSKNTICKEGIVRTINGEDIEVEIIVSSACSGCHAKSICIPSDHKKETIWAKNLNGDTFEIGEKIQLILKESAGNKAVVLAYFLPLLVLMAALFITYAITHNELISVVTSIIFVVLFYFVLKFKMKKIEKEFTFFTKKIIKI